MEQHVLIEQLKESLQDTRVKAALFHTFEFDAEFFEHYLLPVFLPDVPFSDNRIHNAILWRQYQHQLPPVTVYCDFYAKSNKSTPTLPYQVQTVAYRPSFHPKTFFILTEDEKLIFYTGSGNLTESGWCKNLEGYSMLELKNGEYFPENLRQSLREYLYAVCSLVYDNERLYRSATDADRMILDFFYKRKYTPAADISFFHNMKKSFPELLHELKEEHPEETFDEVEILSPYFGDAQPLKYIQEMLSPDRIRVSLPYENEGEVSIPEAFYHELKELGVQWCDIGVLKNEKGFRFNHSKIYRIKGQNTMFTVIGSVNLTNAAFQSFSNKKYPGNLEAALIYKESARQWQSLLSPHQGDVTFLGSKQTEDERHTRTGVPPLLFTLNWQEKKLHYAFTEKDKNLLDRYILSDIRPSKSLREFEESLNIDREEVLQLLADNPLIRVKDKQTREIYYFYPVQEEIDLRPLSSKLTVTDREILALWEELGEEPEITNLSEKQFLEKLIDDKTNEEGELKEDSGTYESTLNLMASHLSGLIRLEHTLFKPAKNKKEQAQKKEQVRYYLYTDNINTLLGYTKLLDDMYRNSKILPAFYWLLLNIVLLNFYKREGLQKIFNGDWQSGKILSQNNEATIEMLNKKIREAESWMKNQSSVNKKHLKWVKEQLREKTDT